MKLGLDIHGVIDKDPKLFSKLTHFLIGAEKHHQIHILTGVRYSKALIDYLLRNDIVWTHFFSITDHHENIGTYIEYKNDDRNSPMIDDYLWDKTKARYCRNKGIDLHIDDSEKYGIHFNTIPTKYIQYDNNLSIIFSALTAGV